MKLPDPARVARPVTLAAGTDLHRLHHVDYPGASFNPCKGAPTRFAPLFDGTTCIPTFYAATTFDGAAYETLFRGIPDPYAGIPRGSLDDRGASLIAPLRDLTLIPFFTPELIGWGLDAATVFSPNISSYPACRALALQAWRDNPAADGLIWNSVRDNSAQAMLIFEGRAQAGNFQTRSVREVRADPDLLADIADAGRRAGFTITR
ncbi:hypothetical protein U879_18715 [Defluviimonas sp. 20V17]|uniref:RES domain-containing protein n=1 Tax=Allgaiera indica TaxID=765699 RepID=A0AAN4USA0_9RHOB|nr:RES family NAD+ phosphorylase [Allgaiera indica]KDB02168.1 hypothetical protein U879_18715 [Defluviimonas sp. 20V17]GHE02618.1 hypothetical protein GCM10008024_22880 [Allgaiera indica]SDX20167.1 RES domain-containing protein [Allgaiera indica]